MNNALRDQLLKAGLVTEDQVKAAGDKAHSAPTGDKPQRPDSKRKRKHGEPRVADKTYAARRKLSTAHNKSKARTLNPEERDQQKSKSSNPAQTPSPYAYLDKNQREAVRRFLREQRENKGDGDTPYHFQEGKAVRKIWVTSQQREDLTKGVLVIVPRNERYYVINALQVDALRSLDPLAEVIRFDASGDTGDDDPAYKEHPIPDDLVW